jgi:hypothetical protein
MGIEPADETYRQIGRFFHRFSQLEFSLRFGLSFLIGVQHDVFDAAMAPYDIAQLCNVAKSVGKKRLTAAQSKNLDKLMGEIFDLNADRVRIAHGTWSDGNSGMANRHVSRTSLEAKSYYGKPGELAALADRAEALKERVMASLFPSG